jgi:hypothetical protein
MQRTRFLLTSITKSTVRRITAKCAVVVLMSLMLGLGSMLAGCCGNVWKDITESLNPDSPPIIYGPIPDTAGPAPQKPAEKK